MSGKLEGLLAANRRIAESAACLSPEVLRASAISEGEDGSGRDPAEGSGIAARFAVFKAGGVRSGTSVLRFMAACCWSAGVCLVGEVARGGGGLLAGVDGGAGCAEASSCFLEQEVWQITAEVRKMRPRWRINGGEILVTRVDSPKQNVESRSCCVVDFIGLPELARRDFEPPRC